MTKKSLHVVAFDTPYPPNYGGIVDVYNKLRILHNLDVNLILHMFYTNKPANKSIEHLNQYCSKIYLYKRRTGFLRNLNPFPYIVASRADSKLLKNLKTDASPIIFEGLHTCFYLSHNDLRNRQKIVRMHNIEWQYYASLMKGESNFLKKLYFAIETLKLKSFEKVIQKAQNILAISPKDYDYLRKKYTEDKIIYIPPFHFTDKLTSKSERGNYILFQGDLSISDTENVLIELIEKALKLIEIPLIITGKNPGIKLTKAISQYSNIELIENPDNIKMKSLIQNAHLILVYSGVKAGMKLKLLNGLYQGRFVVGDENSIMDTGLEELCFIENNKSSLVQLIQEIWLMEYTKEINVKRNIFLEQNFSNFKNGNKILKLLKE